MTKYIAYNEHEKIKKEQENGIYNSIQPWWHYTKDDIDLKKQGDEIKPELIEESYSILEVNLRFLISKFDPILQEIYNDKILYHERQDKLKISTIIYYWRDENPLIPPTILCRDSTIGKGIEDSDILFPQDGKHRINIANFYGADMIPIIVVNKQLEKVKRILNLI